MEFNPSELVIIAGRPTVGKTTLALTMLYNLAVERSIPSAIFCMQMSSEQLAQRFLGNILGPKKIQSGNLTPKEWERFDSQMQQMHKAPLYIEDSPALTIPELQTTAKEMVREDEVQIIFIDNLQLIDGRDPSCDSKTEEHSFVVRKLKELATELQIPIVALSQLSAPQTPRQNNRPRIDDLEEWSLPIRQYADRICFLHHSDDCCPNEEKHQSGEAEFIIHDHRKHSESTTTIQYIYENQHLKFIND